MHKPHRIVVLERSLLLPLSWHFNFPHQLIEYDETSPNQIAERIKEASVIITDHAVPNQAMMAAEPQLALIALTSTGYNHIDLSAAQAHHIAVCNVRNYGEQGIAEHAFMLMLALSRKLLSYHQAVQTGQWASSSAFCYFGESIHDLYGKTLVIFGRGSIGSALAQRAAAFGMQIIYGEQKHALHCRPGYVPFYDALAQADVVSLHCPLTEQTRHMIDAAALTQMKPGSLLINVGRGQLVDEQALLQALGHHLGGAGVDVLSTEPPSADHLLLQKTYPNLIITPHVAWASEEARTRLFHMINDNVNQFMAGTPQHIIKEEK